MVTKMNAFKEQPGELGDEAVAKPKESSFMFQDDHLPSSVLHNLNMMRKNRTFCDVILHVSNGEIPGHRAVLASASPHLMQLFSTEDEKNSNRQAIVSYKLNGLYEKVALEKLVDYAYTAKLELSPNQVRSVFICATQLKMERPAKECANYLVKNLTNDSCIEIRRLTGISRQQVFLDRVDSFIKDNFDEVCKTSVYLNLPCIRIELLYHAKEDSPMLDPDSVAILVLDWLKKVYDEQNFEDFVAKKHLLYLDPDKSLQDCSDIPCGDVSDTDIVQDYKKLSRSTNGVKKKQKHNGGSKLAYSRSHSDGNDDTDTSCDGKVIACSKVTENTLLSLSCLGRGTLISTSIVIRYNPPNNEETTDDNLSVCKNNKNGPIQYTGLANMASVKCAVGCGNLHDKLLVCGGYDRGECLRSVELYSPETNTWASLSPMLEARGRFNIAILSSGEVYAIAGCNGTQELSTVELFRSGRWERVTSLPLSRSHTGVCAIDDLIYCIGGFNGQNVIKQCDCYDPSTDKWFSIAPLHTGRYQAGCCGFQGNIWVVGGCDAWNILDSCEIYYPQKNTWSYGPRPMHARRGAGLAEFNNKIYMVGGWDGNQSLSSVEIYDPETNSWSYGPELTTPRANLGVAVINNCLYAVGGFSSKSFLKSIEILYADRDEWTTLSLVQKTKLDQSQPNIESL
ncbi:influenza virus NS1A-binding protein homolog [Rhodnius prolixus]|uniref:Kelch-like protein diablo n=2 Tax=Rhodnius TaxID=13248 RepID=R4FK95_RHOPR